MILPVEYEKVRLAIQVTENIPAKVLRAIESAAHGNSPSYHVQAVLGVTLQSYGVSIQYHLHCSIARFPITLAVGMVGYINSTPRAVFMSSHFAYGRLCRTSPEDIRWYSERGATDLQINVLLAVLVAAQCHLDDKSVNPQEVSQASPVFSMFVLSLMSIDTLYYPDPRERQDLLLHGYPDQGNGGYLVELQETD